MIRYFILFIILLLAFQFYKATVGSDSKPESALGGYSLMTDRDKQLSYEDQYHAATGGMMFSICASYAKDDEVCSPVSSGTVISCECNKITGESWKPELKK